MAKRSPPPAPSPANSKRQRLSPTRSAATSRTGTPASSAAPSRALSPGQDSLSSLTDDESRGSSPEVQLAAAVKSAPPPAAPPAASTNGSRASSPRKAGGRKKGRGAAAPAEVEDAERVAEAAAEGHHVVSAKTVPSAQPGRKGASNGSSATAGKGSRATQGGKGRRGEEALEHAVAAREEVERRRAQLKEVNGVGVAGARELDQDPKAVKVKEEDVDVEVVHGEDPEEATEAVRLFPCQAMPFRLTLVSQPRKERPSIAEERAGIIRFPVVTNDGKPESMIILTGLKNIFQKQLPKMPREYIARLVFDRAHYSLAIVKRGLEVVGGITYRPFDGQGFAEIVFCAVTGTEQVKVSRSRPAVRRPSARSPADLKLFLIRRVTART